MTDIKLTEWTTCGGCAAKWGAAPLAGLVRALAARDGADPALIVGLAPFDDAAVYRLSDDAALVSTTDFFPPLVDDPSDFGAIAAANACSDVFAMGGRVVLALNISAFPERMPVEAVAAILAAAAAVVTEAGGTIAGGHTIRSEEPIFGLAVQGLVHPDRIWTKAGARPGDVLLLSKPIGTGILLAGGGGRRQGHRHRRHAPAQPGRGRGAVRPRRTRPTPSPTSPASGCSATPGRWRSGRSPSSRSTRRRCRSTPGPWPRPRPASAPAATPATGSTSRAGWSRSAPAAMEALAYDPQTSGGLLAAVAPSAADDPGWPRPASWPSAGWWRAGRACACCNGAPAGGRST